MLFEIAIILWGGIILFWIGWEIAKIMLFFERLERKIDKLAGDKLK